MDSMKSGSDDYAAAKFIIYATVSCIIVTFICVFLYLTCSKRYKLNWFENNLLENARENEENAQRFVHVDKRARKKSHFHLNPQSRSLGALRDFAEQ